MLRPFAEISFWLVWNSTLEKAGLAALSNLEWLTRAVSSELSKVPVRGQAGDGETKLDPNLVVAQARHRTPPRQGLHLISIAQCPTSGRLPELGDLLIAFKIQLSQ